MEIKSFSQFVNEKRTRGDKGGIFLTYNKIVGHDFKKFIDSFKKLNKDNRIIEDKENEIIYGLRKGSKEALWKYDQDTMKLHHSESDSDVLGLINFFDKVKENHPWS